MQTRRLGSSNEQVSAIGLGCMSMSEFYGDADEAEGLAVIHRALELGCNFLDTADIYGRGRNEALVGRAVRDRRDKAFVGTKFGIIRGPSNNPFDRIYNGTPEYVRSACDASLQRLGLDVIDLYYLHRVDSRTPVEETVGAMADLVTAGKVRYLGLSEVTADELRRASAVHPIAALQSEYSLWCRDPEGAVLDTCRELDIALVPFSPLGRGFLTGELRSPDDFKDDDFRRFLPRFQPENFRKNLDLVEQVQALAAEKNCTPAQLALAWVLAQGDDIIPIPGTKREKYLLENLAALEVTLTAEELARINAVMPPEAVAGSRYPENQGG